MKKKSPGKLQVESALRWNRYFKAGSELKKNHSTRTLPLKGKNPITI